MQHHEISVIAERCLQTFDMTNSGFTAELQNVADPIERLTWHYENPAAEAMVSAANGMPVVGITSNTVPWELIRAAGAFPCVINSGNPNHTDIRRRLPIRLRLRLDGHSIHGAAFSEGCIHGLPWIGLFPRFGDWCAFRKQNW